MTIRVLVPVLALLAGMIGHAAANGPRVGALGDPDRLSIVGAHSFSAREIRRRLYDDLTVAAAACPDMQLAALLDILGRQAAEGYRCCGFPDIRAQARVERGGVVLQIDEGPRFLAGDVVVTGARAIDAGRLIAELTASEPEDPPVNPRLRTRSRPGHLNGTGPINHDLPRKNPNLVTAPDPAGGTKYTVTASTHGHFLAMAATPMPRGGFQIPTRLD